MDLLLGVDANVAYEEEVSRNPFDVQTWVSYAQANAKGSARVRNAVLERAVRSIPGSYKLWRMYLADRLAQVQDLAVTDAAVEAATETCERALATMHKMPRIWIMYLRHMVRQRRVTATRRAFDRALRALPVTQHQHVWPLFRAFAQQEGLPVATCAAVFRRLVQFDPSAREDAVHLLLRRGRPAEAARHLAIIVDDARFRSKRGASRHELWMLLCDTIASHAEEVRDSGGLPLAADEAAVAAAGSTSSSAAARVERVFEAGVRQFSDEVGRLWCAHARYHVRLGQFERARDVYEAGLRSVSTVRDFAAVFDAYSQFEESLLEGRMQQQLEAEAEEGGDEPSAEAAPAAPPMTPDGCARELIALRTGGSAALVGGEEGVTRAQALATDVRLRLERLDALVQRRPLLLSSVLLRQNPHNVKEWLRRAEILAERGDSASVVRALREATSTVDPHRATGGRAHELWLRLALEYERSASGAASDGSKPDLSGARRVLERAVEAPAKESSDVAAVWCAWAEMEVRHGDAVAALRVMRRAVEPRSGGHRRRVFGEASSAGTAVHPASAAASAPASASTTSAAASTASAVPLPQAQAHRSARSWALFLDLEEAVGTPDSVAAAYERALVLGVATPRMVLSFADWLAKRGYHERSFRAFERGLASFPWPHAGELWSAYLSRFVERYRGTKLERARALFEEALADAPPEASKDLWLLLAAVEERYGTVRRALAALDRASKQVARRDRAAVYRRWAAKAEEFYGVVEARQVWEEAADAVADADAVSVCLDFAGLEARLGEADRARAILSHAAQFAGRKGEESDRLWSTWRELEVAHGTRETYRAMAMRRREVEAAAAQSGGYTEEELARRAAAMNEAAGGDGSTTRAQKRRRALGNEAEEDGEASAPAKRGATDKDDTGADSPAAAAPAAADTTGAAAGPAARDEGELDIEDL